MRTVYRVLGREPVLLGAIFLAIGDATIAEGSPWRAVAIAAIAWVQRMLSTPEVKVAERLEAATEVGVETGRTAAEESLRELARAKRAARK